MGPTFVRFVLQLITIATIVSKNFAKVEQRYKLKDPAGFDTSYPYEGGRIEIQCKATDGDSTFLTRNNLFGTATSHKVINNTFLLSEELTKWAFGCDGLPKTFLQIEFLHCNPFSIIPKISNCSQNQLCIIDQQGTAKCEDRNVAKCSYSPNADLPDLRFGCNGTSRFGPVGLCHLQMKHKKINTMMSSKDACKNHENNYDWFGRNHVYNDAVLVSFEKKQWDFSSKYNVSINCLVIDENGRRLFEFEIKPGGTTDLEPEFTRSSLPVKVQLRCQSAKSKDGKQVSFSNFVIVYDENESEYKAVVNKARRQESVVLTCTCDVPKGFLCGTTWTNPQKTRDILLVNHYRQGNDPWNLKFSESSPIGTLAAHEHTSEKVVGEWEYPVPRNYTCYMQVFAFNYPNTFNLMRLKLGAEYIESTIIVTAEDFVKNAGASREQAKSTNEAANSINSKTSIIIGLLVFSLILAVFMVIMCVIVCRKTVSASNKLIVMEDKLKSLHTMVCAMAKLGPAGSRVGSLPGIKTRAGSTVGKSGQTEPSQVRTKSNVGQQRSGSN